MPQIETITYTLPAFWACPLINGDLSGLEDEEAEAIEAWITYGGVGACFDVSAVPFFSSTHDARYYVLACDCLEFTFLKG
jgi:hypothetical protein